MPDERMKGIETATGRRREKLHYAIYDCILFYFRETRIHETFVGAKRNFKYLKYCLAIIQNEQNNDLCIISFQILQ